MIRIFKNNITPTSLITTKAYNGQDVQRQLLEDQHSKCYLCERSVTTDYQIEHFLSQVNCNNNVQGWQNLLLSCNYCNSKKLEHFDNILNPLLVNIEKEIKQEIDLDSKKAIFSSIGEGESVQHQQTIRLLNLIFNGTNKIRMIREECFFEYVIGVYNRFKQHIADYVICPKEEIKDIIIEELSINSELLGIKYWMIMSHATLREEFSQYIIWNKL